MIKITYLAKEKFLEIFTKDKKTIGIEIVIKKSGCAGLEYGIEKMYSKTNALLLYKKNKIKIFSQKKNLKILKGTKIDFIQDELNSSFKFYNPNAISICGCGESFNTE
ncbi:HesB/IscA family protein [bacterium endosymbiont of Pedicinus badii]|uniref:HesB/IscA family protein n=1 Tax=bacterium endosymbiont of Pedicinus badii TaxID=1719126 RepID=UPI0009B967B7|nr:iron-sulfur cluster assembly accessory protein [bacterium endosymbiont of Pedicinus badii]OQM34389.1 hypothetical protein AOQ89_00670 [bacterium endosymbiont of Pedicinus badii]